MVRSLTIFGYRGFASAGRVDLAVPNGSAGSGLTVIVGPNNGGKSTVMEALGAVVGNDRSFTERKRNRTAGDGVDLRLDLTDGRNRTMQTIAAGGSQAETRGDAPAPKVLALPSRRYFPTFFGSGGSNRENYAQQLGRREERFVAQLLWPEAFRGHQAQERF